MFVEFTKLLTSPVVLGLLGYAGLVVALALVLQPMRLRMVRLAESLLAESKWNRAQREEINDILDSMDSPLRAIVFPIALIVGTGIIVFKYELPRDKNLEQLLKSNKFDELTTLHFVSLLGANPLVAAITIPLIVICVPIMLIGIRGTFMESVEKPVLQASTAVMAAYENRIRLAA
jgi:hypothetical protein